MSVDDSSSANESSSEVISLPKSLRKSKRPPPPVNLNRNKNLELQSVPDSNNEELDNNNSVLGLVNCPLCGKQFGKNSIKFHTRQCQKRQQILKDRQESDKKSPPQQPIEEAEGKNFVKA